MSTFFLNQRLVFTFPGVLRKYAVHIEIGKRQISATFQIKKEKYITSKDMYVHSIFSACVLR